MTTNATVTLVDSAWTLMATGPILVTVQKSNRGREFNWKAASSLPAATETDGFGNYVDDNRPMTIDIATGENLYGRSDVGDLKVFVWSQ